MLTVKLPKFDKFAYQNYNYLLHSFVENYHRDILTENSKTKIDWSHDRSLPLKNSISKEYKDSTLNLFSAAFSHLLAWFDFLLFTKC